jgi:hypothetical protein
MKRLIIVFLILFNFPALAGGGWVQPKNKGYFKLNQYAMYANTYFAPSGDLLDITTTGFYSTSLYAEHGITSRLTGIIYAPVFVRSTLNRQETAAGELVQPGDHLNSIGDVDVTVKYGLITDKSWVMSAALTLGLPLGENSGGSTRLLQTGDGEFNQLVTLELSHSLKNNPLYFSLLTGFNNRTNQFSDEFRYGAEIGVGLDRLYALIRFYGIKSLFNGADSPPVANGLFANNVEYLSVTPEIGYKIGKNWGVAASVGGAFFAKNILAAPGYSFGIYLQY